MTPAEWDRCKELFADTLETEPGRRREFLDSACAHTPHLLPVVRALLSEQEESPSFLEAMPVQRLRLSPSEETVAESALPPETLIGGYRIIRLIGRGGMGAVYEAEQERPRRSVALKLMTMGLGSRSARRRFEFEAEILGKLDHPGIARIYEAGVYEELSETAERGPGERRVLPYFAMELIRGLPLDAYAQENRLSTAERLALLAAVCEAIEHAHLHGIVHRDLKPANILVDEAGKPRIVDFGVALAPERAADLTLAGAPVGTLAYMSPEQAGAGRSVDHRADIYALGVVAFRLLTGEHPYSAGDFWQMAKAIREHEPRPAGLLNPNLRGDVEAILRTALAKSPEDRYQSAGTMALDIRRHLNDLPISVRGSSAGTEIRKFARRNRGVVVAASVSSMLLLGGILATSWQAVRAWRYEGIAQKRADHLTELLDSLLNFAESVRQTPGSFRARETIVNDVLPALDGIARQTPDDVRVQRTLAKGYLAMGSQLGQVNAANLGRPQEAVGAFEKVLSIYERVGADDPLAIPATHWRLGLALVGSGQAKEADLHFARAAEYCRERAAMQRVDFGMLELWASILLERVRWSVNEGEIDKARAIATGAAESLAPFTGTQPQSAQQARSLTEIYIALGEIAYRLGDYDRALWWYNGGFPLMVLAEQLEPAAFLPRLVNGSLHRCRAKVLLDMRQYQEASECFGAAVVKYREAEAIETGRGDAQESIATACAEFALAAAQCGRTAEALNAVDESARSIAALVQADPADHRLRRNSVILSIHWARAMHASAADPALDPAEREQFLIRGCNVLLEAERSTEILAQTSPNIAAGLRGLVSPVLAALESDLGRTTASSRPADPSEQLPRR
jgi:serine/threonine protein kinase